MGTSYPLSVYMSYPSLSDPYYKVIYSISSVREPDTHEEALYDPQWVVAMQQELQAFQDNHT